MASTAVPPLDVELRGILEQLSEGLFPLAAWIADKIQNGRYEPPGHIPWRDQGASLSPKDTGAIDFFEELLEQSARDEPLAARFARLTKKGKALRYRPLDNDAAAWRAKKGLDAVAQFGIVASGNVIATVDGTPVTRAQFYAPYWPLLRQATTDAAKQSPIDWQAWARDLAGDTSAHWPANQPLKSSSFIKQFGRDILHAMLNQRNPASDPWRVAVLEELGEHRRVGNSFTRDDAGAFVQAFLQQMNAP